LESLGISVIPSGGKIEARHLAGPRAIATIQNLALKEHDWIQQYPE